MSLDLTEAIEAAARGWFESAPEAPPYDEMSPMVKHRARETMLPGVTAAAPLIEAQVRAQIAEEIEADRTYGKAWRDHYASLARDGA